MGRTKQQGEGGRYLLQFIFVDALFVRPRLLPPTIMIMATQKAYSAGKYGRKLGKRISYLPYNTPTRNRLVS